MRGRHPHAKRRAALGALGVVLGLMALLGLAFFRVQVLRSSTYRLQANSNRLRALPIPAPRGTVYDRNGVVIADNVPGYAVTVLYERRDSALATVERLRPYLELDDADVEALVRTLDRYPRQPLVVDTDADFEAVSRLEERRAAFPDVWIEMRPKRRYRAGEALFHVLGYIGEITAEELESDFYGDRGYEPGMSVGKTGIERQYEARLQGKRGVRYVEVDARGRIVGDFGGTIDPGSAGGDLRLNLDVALQEWIHEIFPAEKSGAVVALDPADGAVLALYSAPTTDANAFVGGIASRLWTRLNEDPENPLFNRAVAAALPPASTFKPVVAGLALEMGAVRPEELMPLSCDGGMMYGGVYRRCWNPDGHGRVSLVEAIGTSCDVYFYQLGLRIGLDPFLERAGSLELGGSCGIDLPQERAGSFPESRDYWERVHGYRAREGEMLSLAIGQGPNSQTPLRVAQMYAAMAGDGTAPTPSLLSARAPDERWHLGVSSRTLERIRRGLAYVTSPEGTAYFASLEHWDLIGKSGTAESVATQSGAAETNAWFAGIAGPPGGPPEVVVVALVEEGGGGSAVAAPVVAKAADFYLRRRHGLPLDSVQTLGEHLQVGPWPDWAVGR